MPPALIRADQLGKKFCRTWHDAALYGLSDFGRALVRLRPREDLRKGEFWALRDVSFELHRGECLGVIGPNGAGKTTLLRLLNRDYRPDRGQVVTHGATRSLIRIGSGLHPLLSGRENIHVLCAQLGLDKRTTDARVDEIIAFAELEQAIDAPVKTYSDGMYARLEFAIATSAPTDILLIDEVLAVGDIAFQIRCLDRLNRLKRDGTTIVFVSHSEMNVRQVADRCLLLFDGRQIDLGEPDIQFYRYYAAIGYLDRDLKPLGTHVPQPGERSEPVRILELQPLGHPHDFAIAQTGGSLELDLRYEAQTRLGPAALVVQFRTPSRVLVGSVDSRLRGDWFTLARGSGNVRVRLPYFPLSAGLYHLGAGFLTADGNWLGYRGNLLDVQVKQGSLSDYAGFVLFEAEFEV